MYTLRNFLNEMILQKELLEINKEVDTKYEIAYYLKKYDQGPILLFNKVKNKKIKVIGNILSKRERLLKAFKIKNENELYLKLIKACENPLKTKPKSDAPFMEITQEKLDVLPILLHYEKDGGPYITSGIVFAPHPKLEFQNASYHRLMFLDPKHLAIRIVPRHLYLIYEEYKKRQSDTPVAIVVGTHPSVMISAASSPSFGVSELQVANRLADGKLETTIVEVNGYEIEVPRDAEIVITGRILHDVLADEGPFVDITGTYDIVRKQPVIEISRIFLRENAYYQALLPASNEHRLLMGFFREALIWYYASRIVQVKKVRLTKGGCGWLHCIISIKKKTEGDAKNVIMAAFAAHPSLKMVIVVDDDIDVDNLNEIEWALATRFQADEDLVIIRKARGSSLDPSADQVNLLTTKVGIDATRPLFKPYKDFERAIIPFRET